MNIKKYTSCLQNRKAFYMKIKYLLNIRQDKPIMIKN